MLPRNKAKLQLPHLIVTTLLDAGTGNPIAMPSPRRSPERLRPAGTAIPRVIPPAFPLSQVKHEALFQAVAPAPASLLSYQAPTMQAPELGSALLVCPPALATLEPPASGVSLLYVGAVLINVMHLLLM